LGSSQKKEIFTRFFEKKIGCGEEEYLAAPPNFFTIGFSSEELWENVVFDGWRQHGYGYIYYLHYNA